MSTNKSTEGLRSVVLRGFFGRNAWLGNSYPAAFRIDGLTWKSVDHYVFAKRAIKESDRDAVREAETPIKARTVSKTMRWRPDWKEADVENVKAAVEAKFFQNVELGRKLIYTRDIELVHENRWGDKLWGVCEGEGENLLGKLLMEIREKLMESEVHSHG